MGIIAGALASAFEKVAETVVNYAADAAAGHIGYKALTNIIDECADSGAELAGDIGRTAGKVVGKVLAGTTLPIIQEETNALSNSVRTISAVALDTAKKETKSNWVNTAWKVTKFAASGLGIAIVAAGMFPAAPVALATAAIAAVPDVINAIRQEVKPEEKPHLVDDVMIPTVKQLLFTAAGAAVGNYVRAETVLTAFNDRIEQFTETGKAIGSYLPDVVAPFVEKAAAFAGKIDAGRYAMSDNVIKGANSAADLAQNAVQAGLQVGDAVIADAKPSKNWKDVARRVFWLGTGALGIGALVAMAPQVAAVTGGVAAIGVAGDGIKWAKAKLMKNENKAIENSMRVVLENLKPVAKIEELPLAACAA